MFTDYIAWLLPGRHMPPYYRSLRNERNTLIPHYSSLPYKNPTADGIVQTIMGKRQRKMSASSSPAKAAANGLEPRFSLPPSTPLSSKRSLVIGGVQIYIYGLDELKQPSGVEVAVLYLAHNRTRTYLVTEGIAHEILHRYRTDGREKRMEMIAVTMNMRNHGDREVRFRQRLLQSVIARAIHLLSVSYT